MNILFVCTGNICRSPMAEGIFGHMVRQAGLEHCFLVDSAGTHAFVNNPPDILAQAFETVSMYSAPVFYGKTYLNIMKG